MGQSLHKLIDVAALLLGWGACWCTAAGAGKCLYIAASDLVPEIKARPGPAGAALNFTWFAAGMGFMLALALHLHGR